MVSDHVAVLNDQSKSFAQRADALRSIWAEAEIGLRPRDVTREQLKEIVWEPTALEGLRHVALELLLDDQDAAGQADSRELIKLMLPTEATRTGVALMASRAAARDWRDATPALVRSLSRRVPAVAEDDRAERIALSTLYPDRSVRQVAFDVFVGSIASPDSPEAAARVRRDAWDLLEREDPTGRFRAEQFREIDSVAMAVPPLSSMRTVQRRFGVLPRTGQEIEWADSIVRTAGGTWSTRVQEGVSRLSGVQRRGLRLQHLEPIRWAGEFRSSWVTSEQNDLYELLRAELEPRRKHRRTAGGQNLGRGVPDRLEEWKDRLSWGDLITLLTVDVASRDPEVVEALWMQAAEDRRDTRTEYGGMLVHTDTAGWRAVMYQPRARDRGNDRVFVASEDLIGDATKAIAIYHFHAQSLRNVEYAGPSDADIDFAKRSGRASVVFTTVDKDAMNVDCVLPSGAVVDLGRIERPRAD